jgi:hypothetical protein
MEIRRIHNRHKSELVLKFQHGETRLSFALDRHEISPKGRQILEVSVSDDGAQKKGSAITRSTKSPHPDWFTKISEQDKSAIFMNILDYYRTRSEGDRGIKAAAIGVFRDPETQKIRIFIGMNTKRQHPYFKDCAELNMMTAANHALNHSSLGKGTDDFPKPSPLEVHVMGGRSEEKESKGIKIPITCPCGKCTDMFGYSTQPDAAFYIYPVPQRPFNDHWNWTAQDRPYKIVDQETAQDISQIDPQKQIWKIPFDHLNKDRILVAEKSIAALETAGLKTALERIVTEREDPATLPEVRIDFDEEAAVHYGHPQTPEAKRATALSAHANGHDALVKITNRDGSEQSPKGVKRFLAVMARATQNAFNRVDSIPELDVARTKDGEIDLESVNAVMVEKIVATMASRLRVSGVNTETEPQQWQEEFLAKLGVVRCAVIQLKDGTFHYGLEVAGDLDSSLPNAEVNALTSAIERLGENRVKQIFVMEMNPSEIAYPKEKSAPSKFHTSPKEGVERILKRAMPGVTFHFLPFNNANISNDALEKVVRTYEAPMIYPGGFGTHTARAAQAPPSSHGR